MRSIGVDIGTNSVASAWVDTENPEDLKCGVSIFPAGVEKSDRGRGAPKNQTRRSKRSQRRTLRRRAERKAKLRAILEANGLLPTDKEELRHIFGPRKEDEVFDLERWNPWHLRRDALFRQLTPHELGRVLVHINQRRGSAEIKLDEDHQITEKDEEDSEPTKETDSSEESNKSQREERRKATAAVRRTAQLLDGKTFGHWMADEYDKRLAKETDHVGNRIEHRAPIRNLRNRLTESNAEAILANRQLIRHEFESIWEHQKTYSGELGRILNGSAGESLTKMLLDPTLDAVDSKKKSIWRDGGAIFGQRKTYWKVDTLGRCDLEPTDRCIFKIDMYAQQFRVVELVNNITITEFGEKRSLGLEERNNLIEYLSTPQTVKNRRTKKREPQTKVKVADIKEQLRIDKASLDERSIPENAIESSLDKLGDRDININWFSRRYVHGAFGASHWESLGEEFQDQVNRELLRLDPESDEHSERLLATAIEHWKLDAGAADRLLAIWKDRPNLDRINLSRRAIRNLLPYLLNAFTDRAREPGQPSTIYWLSETPFDKCRHRWLTEIEARQAFAENPNAIDQTGKALVRDMRRKDKDAKPFCVSHEIRMRYAHTVTEPLKSLVLTELGGDADKFKRAVQMRGLRKRDLHYQKRHPDQILPPAPKLSNPVVRKAIHVVRDHIIEHIRSKGQLPDQIVIELAREIRQTAKIRDAVLKLNQNRNQIRKAIAEQWKYITKGDPRHPAVDRVLLCRQQNFTCPYSGMPRGKHNPAEEGHCIYTGETISEQKAADGIGVEIDHIVPMSRGGDDGLNNKVLCLISANRRKANATPKQSLKDADFEALEQRMRHLKKRPADGDYFTKKDYLRKWENLHRDPKPDDFRKSQLSDTAYAAKQVGAYLRAAFANVDNAPEILFTKGSYTNVLRKDWRLMTRLPDPWRDDLTDEERKQRRELLAKKRDDHRHHAVDAVIIALTVNQREPQSDYLDILKHEMEELEKELEQLRERNVSAVENWPRRNPLPPPWPGIRNSADNRERNKAWQTFRRDVLSRIYAKFDVMLSRSKGEGTESGQALIVSHCPLRRIYDRLHEDTPYGEAREFRGLYVTRKFVTALKPGHFIKPRRERDGTWKIPGKGQGQAIRDPRLRDDLAHCLSDTGVRIVAEDLGQKSQLKSLVENNCLEPRPDLGLDWQQLKVWLDETKPRLRIPFGDNGKPNIGEKVFAKAIEIFDRHGALVTQNGTPIRSIRLLLALSDPVLIESWDNPHERRVIRYFKGGNNHHLAIFEDKDGRWTGASLSMKDMADRNRERLTALKYELKEAGVPPLYQLRKNRSDFYRFRNIISRIASRVDRRLPLIRRDDDGKKFKLSLAIGETVYLRDKEGQPEFFRVVEVKKASKKTKHKENKVVLVPHWDNRQPKGPKVIHPRTEYPLHASQIKDLIFDEERLKARISPLGQVDWITD